MYIYLWLFFVARGWDFFCFWQNCREALANKRKKAGKWGMCKACLSYLISCLFNKDLCTRSMYWWTQTRCHPNLVSVFRCQVISYTLHTVCFSYVLGSQVGLSSSSTWTLKVSKCLRGKKNAWLWSWLCTPAICTNLHEICISSLITTQMCGKYGFNQLSVGKVIFLPVLSQWPTVLASEMT